MRASVASCILDIVSGDWGSADGAGCSDAVPCYVIRGTDFPSVQLEQFGQVPRRFLRPASLSKRQLRPDDMLIEISGGSKRQPTGRVLRITAPILARTDLPLAFTNFLKLARVDTRAADPLFFELFWDHLYELGKTRIYEKRTTGIRNFKYREFFEQETILLPPLVEQCAIAYVLNTVQRARKATEVVIAAAREVKRSLMRHLFTYGIGPARAAQHLALAESEIGSLPAHWQLERLGNLVAWGPQNGLYKPADYYGEGSPILRIDAFDAGDMITTQGLKRLRVTSAELTKYALREGDLIINRVNGSVDLLGKCALVGSLPESTVFESNMMRFHADTQRVSPRFLLEVLSSALVRGQIRKSARVIHQASINQQDLASFIVPFPPLAEQEQIVAMLAAVRCKIEAEEKRREALNQLFRSLLQQLMTGQTRLDPAAIMKEEE